MDLRELLLKILSKFRIFHIEASFVGIMMFALFLVVSLQGYELHQSFEKNTSANNSDLALGEYNPYKNEISIYVNESEDRYDRVLFHEQKHREFFQNYSIAMILQHLKILSLPLLFLGILFLDYRLASLSFITNFVPTLIIEGYAIFFTFLEFYSVSSVTYLSSIIIMAIPQFLLILMILWARRDYGNYPAIYNLDVVKFVEFQKELLKARYTDFKLFIKYIRLKAGV